MKNKHTAEVEAAAAAAARGAATAIASPFEALVPQSNSSGGANYVEFRQGGKSVRTYYRNISTLPVRHLGPQGRWKVLPRFQHQV